MCAYAEIIHYHMELPNVNKYNVKITVTSYRVILNKRKLYLFQLFIIKKHGCARWALHGLQNHHQTNIKYQKKSTYILFNKTTGCLFDIESPLLDEKMDADGDFKNEKVRKKKDSPPSNSSIPRTFATETPRCEASKGY